MNIIEARRSSKKIKPVGSQDFYEWEDWAPDAIKINLLREWEVEEQKIELSWSQIEKAFEYGINNSPTNTSWMLRHVRLKLGFESEDKK